MKTYVVYETEEYHSGIMDTYYLKDDGTRTLNVTEARRFDVRYIIEIIIIVLQLILKHKTNLKYKRI